MEDPRTSFVFPPYRLDPDERRLSRDGEVVPLTPKEFDTLLVLVEAAGRVVEKEDLIGLVWPGSYVGDGSLARNISVLRKALGEGVIETLPKKGYRINVPVNRVEGGRKPAIVEEGVESNPQPGLAGPAEVIPPAVYWWRRRALVWVTVVCAVLLGMAVRLPGMKSRMRSTTAKADPVQTILIQKEGAIDPLDEGFKVWGDEGNYTHIVRNAANTGFDRWKLITRDQSSYYRPLSDAEKQFAMQRDWILTCICALEKGAGSSIIDLGPGIGPRFDMAYLQEGNRYFVVLTQQISPEYEFYAKVEFPGVGDIDHPHTFEMRYDHVTQSASLWIDGQQRATGYRGHHQFQQNGGLMLSAATYLKMPESSIVFRRVRFEAR